ncbi:unnamed protein product [Rhizoctonia solani]|uniref:Zn(2)-C6 fungal-type domain-containing protein n=1 Tax=Rhizoctonia solani TaxID=456999 RepID=A0A8H3CX33_9AGAM|nr:unnamed protein product [Rhizoctonia solani]
MSTLPRSSTGCLTCKCRRKKCDETKPKCLRCQKSGLECSGYTYIQGKNKKVTKPRTLPAPRESKVRVQDTDSGTPSSSTDYPALGATHKATESVELSGDLFDFALIPVSFNPLESLGGLESIPTSTHESTLSEFDFMPSGTIIQNGALRTSSAVLTSPIGSSVTAMTPGQASLLSALFSLSDNPPIHQSNSPPFADHNTASFSNGPTWLSPDPEEEALSAEEEDPEGVSQIICQPLALDKNAESNALPFILQGFAAWVVRMAHEPLKMAALSRKFVIRQFEDGQESRYILGLLTNIGAQLGRGGLIDETHLSMVSALQTQVRRRLTNVKIIGDDGIGRRELIKALEAALETVIIHFFISPARDWLTLRYESAPLFRRLCPEPPGLPINLPSLLQHSDYCLRRYVHLDILASTMMDIPMLFRYDCTQNAHFLHEPVEDVQTESGAQWFHGTPERIVAIFAKINAMREDGWIPTPEVISLFEHGIQEFQPTRNNSPDSFLSVTRLVVQECWRQVAYMYLYMGLCGDSSDTPRVKRALKQFMKLLEGTKPGRMPDEFLIMNMMLIAPAAQREREREIIRKRIRGLEGRSRGIKDNMTMVEDYWARADAERRAIMWSDIAWARKRVVGI